MEEEGLPIKDIIDRNVLEKLENLRNQLEIKKAQQVGNERSIKRDAEIKQQKRLSSFKSGFKQWESKTFSNNNLPHDEEQSPRFQVDSSESQPNFTRLIEDRDKLNYSYNVIFHCYDSLVAFMLQADLDSIGNRYNNYLSNNLADNPNHILALVLGTEVQTQQRMLDRYVGVDCNKLGINVPISYQLSTRILADYFEDIFLQCETTLNFPDNKTTSKNTVPYLVESSLECIARLEEELSAYPGFTDQSKSVSEKLIKVKQKLAELQAQLIDKSEHLVGIDKIPGWFFYSTASYFPVKGVTKLIGSHSPDLNWHDYFDRHFSKSGILVEGTPIRFFSTDMHSDDYDLSLWDEWTVDKSAIKYVENLYADQKNSGKLPTEKELIKEFNDVWGIHVCSNLQEAWDKRKGYSEVWIQNPIAYAIWIPNDFEQIAEYFSLHALQKLLNNRPDLPIIRQGQKELVSRKELTNFITDKLAQKK